jgi:hypothetical protein
MHAIEVATAAGQVPPDLGGRCTTHQVADSVIAALAGQ